MRGRAGVGVVAAMNSGASWAGSARGRAVAGLPRFMTSSPASRKAPVPYGPMSLGAVVTGWSPVFCTAPIMPFGRT